VFDYIDKVTAIIFVVDYLLRLWTADMKLKQGGKSFVLYPFTPMAIVDLISILPSVTLLNSGWRLLKIFRLFRTFRVFRVFKAIRYSRNIQLFITVFKKQREALLTIIGIAVVAMPASVITAGFMDELNKDKEKDKGEDTDRTEV
jgi:voltage-gated potassium channel